MPRRAQHIHIPQIDVRENSRQNWDAAPHGMRRQPMRREHCNEDARPMQLFDSNSRSDLTCLLARVARAIRRIISARGPGIFGMTSLAEASHAAEANMRKLN
jgi:hypothetical protein